MFQSKELDGCCGSSTRLKKGGTAGIGGTQRLCRAKPSAPREYAQRLDTSFSMRLEVVEFAERAVQNEIYCYFFGSEKIT
jgi:hypothetical protein